MNEPLTVIVAEDEFVTRAGIVHLLSSAGFQILAEVGDLESLLEAAAERRPDVVVTDVRMPPTRTTEGLMAAREIFAERPTAGVLVLSQVDDPEQLAILLDGRRSIGYLLKERLMEADTLVAAVRRVAAGECVIDPQVVAAVLGRRRRTEPLDVLTKRERDVLASIAEGLSNSAVAQRMHVSERTVEVHVSAVLAKLGLDLDHGVNRRVLAVLEFLRSAP